jgi:hypothetical protein
VALGSAPCRLVSCAILCSVVQRRTVDSVRDRPLQLGRRVAWGVVSAVCTDFGQTQPACCRPHARPSAPGLARGSASGGARSRHSCCAGESTCCTGCELQSETQSGSFTASAVRSVTPAQHRLSSTTLSPAAHGCKLLCTDAGACRRCCTGWSVAALEEGRLVPGLSTQKGLGG